MVCPFSVGTTAGGGWASADKAFTIVKVWNYLHICDSSADEIRPRSVLELGIYRGGSFIPLDRLWNPDKRMSGPDISNQSGEPLMRYISQAEDRYAHFGVSQSDKKRTTLGAHGPD